MNSIGIDSIEIRFDLAIRAIKMPAAILSRPATPERGKGATVQATAIRLWAGMSLVVPDNMDVRYVCGRGNSASRDFGFSGI
jgi:predicted aminopeptidase